MELRWELGLFIITVGPWGATQLGRSSGVTTNASASFSEMLQPSHTGRTSPASCLSRVRVGTTQQKKLHYQPMCWVMVKGTQSRKLLSPSPFHSSSSHLICRGIVIHCVICQYLGCRVDCDSATRRMPMTQSRTH